MAFDGCCLHIDYEANQHIWEQWQKIEMTELEVVEEVIQIEGNDGVENLSFHLAKAKKHRAIASAISPQILKYPFVYGASKLFWREIWNSYYSYFAICHYCELYPGWHKAWNIGKKIDMVIVTIPSIFEFIPTPREQAGY